MAALLQSIAILAAFALVIGGIVLIVRRRQRRQGGLMIVAGIVLLVNVAIWAIPIAPAGR